MMITRRIGLLLGGLLAVACGANDATSSQAITCTGSGTFCDCAPSDAGSSDTTCSAAAIQGGDGVCCASADYPASGACSCTITTHCYTSGSGTLLVCKCSVTASAADGTSTASCTPPSGGHCCVTGQGSPLGASCSCSSTACLASETEVPSCSQADTAPTCAANEHAVDVCH